jgi:hypothetical protein
LAGEVVVTSDDINITLLLVPVFYAIFVLDLKWITWDAFDL